MKRKVPHLDRLSLPVYLTTEQITAARAPRLTSLLTTQLLCRLGTFRSLKEASFRLPTAASVKMASVPADRDLCIGTRFPWKLYRLINSCDNGAMAWSPAGDCFKVDVNRFERFYLQDQTSNRPFKTTNFPSFVRQLNLYNFRKKNVKERSKGTTVVEFHHEFFRRGRIDLLHLVTRAKSTTRPSSAQKLEAARRGLADRFQSRLFERTTIHGAETPNLDTFFGQGRSGLYPGCSQSPLLPNNWPSVETGSRVKVGSGTVYQSAALCGSFSQNGRFGPSGWQAEDWPPTNSFRMGPTLITSPIHSNIALPCWPILVGNQFMFIPQENPIEFTPYPMVTGAAAPTVTYHSQSCVTQCQQLLNFAFDGRNDDAFPLRARLPVTALLSTASGNSCGGSPDQNRSNNDGSKRKNLSPETVVKSSDQNERDSSNIIIRECTQHEKTDFLNSESSSAETVMIVPHSDPDVVRAQNTGTRAIDPEEYHSSNGSSYLQLVTTSESLNTTAGNTIDYVVNSARYPSLCHSKTNENAFSSPFPIEDLSSDSCPDWALPVQFASPFPVRVESSASVTSNWSPMNHQQLATVSDGTSNTSQRVGYAGNSSYIVQKFPSLEAWDLLEQFEFTQANKVEKTTPTREESDESDVKIIRLDGNALTLLSSDPLLYSAIKAEVLEVPVTDAMTVNIECGTTGSISQMQDSTQVSTGAEGTISANVDFKTIIRFNDLLSESGESEEDTWVAPMKLIPLQNA